jgi:hypothetical protein
MCWPDTSVSTRCPAVASESQHIPSEPVPCLVNGRVGRILWVPEDLKASPRLLTHTTRSRRSNMILAVIANSGYTTERSGAEH